MMATPPDFGLHLAAMISSDDTGCRKPGEQWLEERVDDAKRRNRARAPGALGLRFA